MGEKARILLVTKDPTYADALELALRTAGCEVTVSSDTGESVACLGSVNPGRQFSSPPNIPPGTWPYISRILLQLRSAAKR